MQHTTQQHHNHNGDGATHPQPPRRHHPRILTVSCRNRHARTTRTGSQQPRICPKPHRNQHPSDRRSNNTKQQTVGLKQVSHVRPTGRPLRIARRLRHRRLRHQQTVIRHTKQLITSGKRQSGHHNQAAPPPRTRPQQQHKPSDRTIQSKLGAHQPTQAAPQGGKAQHPGRIVTHPRHQHPPQHRDPKNAQTPLEPRRRKIARGRQRQVHQPTERHEQQTAPECGALNAIQLRRPQ